MRTATAYAIQKATNGGYAITMALNPDDPMNHSMVAAMSTLPEAMEWLAGDAGRTFGDTPYRAPVLQLPRAVPQSPLPPPMPRRPPPPDAGMHQPAEASEPIPAGILPEGVRSLTDRIGAEMLGPNGRIASIVPLALCILAWNFWPFGA